ncbi:MAG: MerR family transcriptional regulator [Saprospiraceae bacterium]|nr:MerR family transcriptional regulator [Saprospiraceae bacterium]
MQIPPEQLNKRYYSIGEIADMFGVSKSLIRYWEAEFDLLKPHKNSKGERRFTPANIEQFQIIYHLVKERGFTLNGAKQELKDQRERAKKQGDMLKTLKKVRKLLVEIQSEL